MKKIVIITVLLQVIGITTACTNMVSFDIDDNGVAREIVFPKITESTKNNATTVSPDVLKKVTSGARKRDLLYLLGAPHFRESNAAREWDYAFKTPNNGELCQYKIIFDKNMRARSFIWKDNNNCQKYFVSEQ